MADGNRTAHKRARNDDSSTPEINPKRSKIDEDLQSASYRENLAEGFAEKFGLDRVTAATLVEQSLVKNVSPPSHPLPSMDVTDFATDLIHINEAFTKILYASLGELVPGLPVILDGEIKTVMTKTQLRMVGNLLARRRNSTSSEEGLRQIASAPTNYGLTVDTNSRHPGDNRGSLDVHQLSKTAPPFPPSMGKGTGSQGFEAAPKNQRSHSGPTAFGYSYNNSVSAGPSSSQQPAQSQQLIQYSQNHVPDPQLPQPVAPHRQSHVLPPKNQVYQAQSANLSAPGPSVIKPEAEGSKANNKPAGRGKGPGRKSAPVKVVPEAQRIPLADRFKERVVPSLPVMEAQRGGTGAPQTATQQLHPQNTTITSPSIFNGNAPGQLLVNTGSSNPFGSTYRGPFSLDQIPAGSLARFQASMPNNAPAPMQRSITHPAPPPTNHLSGPLDAPSSPITAPIPRVAGYAAIPPVNIAHNLFQPDNIQQYHQNNHYRKGQHQQYNNTTGYSNGGGPTVAPPMMSRSISDHQRYLPSQCAQQQQPVQYQFIETTFNSGSDGAGPSRSRNGGRGRSQKNVDDSRKQVLAQNTNTSNTHVREEEEEEEDGVQQDRNSPMMASQQLQGQAQLQQFNFSQAPQLNVNFPVNELSTFSYSSFPQLQQQQQQQKLQPEVNYASTFMAQPAAHTSTFVQQQQNPAQLQASRQLVLNTPLARPGASRSYPPTSTLVHPHHQGYQQQQQQQQQRQPGNSVMAPVNPNLAFAMAQFQQLQQQLQPRQQQQAPQQNVGSFPARAPVNPDVPHPISIPTLYQQQSQVGPAATAPTSSRTDSPFSFSASTFGTGPVMPVVSAPTPQIASPFSGLVVASATSGPIIASVSDSSASALATQAPADGGEAGENHPDDEATDSDFEGLFGGGLSSLFSDHE